MLSQIVPQCRIVFKITVVWRYVGPEWHRVRQAKLARSSGWKSRPGKA
jgi:hypothetical protein